VARAIRTGVSKIARRCDIAVLPHADMRSLESYDLIGVGSPVWNGVPLHVKRFVDALPRLTGKHTFTFCTHGTVYVRFFPTMVRLLMKKGLVVVGTGHWYGSVNHPLFPKPYLTDGHPDEIDLTEAERFGESMVEISERIAAGETGLIPAVPPMPPPRTLKRPMAHMKFHTQKCRYPECTLCMEHCRLRVIDLSVSPPIFPSKCQPCYFCEMICPTGAIEIDYQADSLLETGRARSMFVDALGEAEAQGRFRRLIPREQIGWTTPFYKVYDKHPRYVIPENDYEAE